MNFNFTQQPEYSLNSSLINEVINLYGIQIKLLEIKKINKDDLVFGDFSHLKTDSTKIHTFNVLPENTEDWDSAGYKFTDFGFLNFENITLFAHRDSFATIGMSNITKIIGNLIVFPNNKIMEITNVDFVVPGINNMFTYNDVKSVYMLVCKPYSFKLTDELDQTDISYEDNEQYDTLDKYLDELTGEKEFQDEQIHDIETVVTVQDIPNQSDVKTKKPIVDTSEDDVWGQFS